MSTFWFHYPGDPVLSARWMTGAEFRAEQPNRSVTVTTSERTTVFPFDDVLCDHCNERIDPDARCCLTGDWLYCEPCANECLVPYTVKGAHATNTKES